MVEMTAKAKHAGIGAGLSEPPASWPCTAGGALVATAIAALALVLDLWLAALIVTVVLFAVAGAVALVGRKQVTEATPAAPQTTIDNVKADVAAVQEARSHER